MFFKDIEDKKADRKVALVRMEECPCIECPSLSLSLVDVSGSA